MIQCVLVEDEKAGQLILTNKLKTFYPQCEIIAVLESKYAALDFLENNPIDLLFLDAQIRGGTGLEILETLYEWEQSGRLMPSSTNKKQLHAYSLPEVVFITAYQEYAMEALNTKASYYLLKPIQEHVFKKGMDTIMNRIAEKQAKQSNLPTTLLISYKNENVNVRVDQILYLRSEGAYTYFHMNDRVILSSKNIGYYQVLFTDLYFIRCHHSYLVNVRRIDKIIRQRTGQLIMSNGEQIPVSQRKLADLLSKMNIT